MRSDNNQMDIFNHDPRRMAALNRVAADQARHAYNFPPTVRDDRVKHYEAEAERYEALAAMCGEMAHG